MENLRPFRIEISQEQLDDLTRRLNAVRWPEAETVEDWSQGVPLDACRGLVAHWLKSYDWRACEDRLNGFDQHLAQVDGLDIHFLHVRSPHEDALPLILTHGWPGSVIEFLEVLGPLSDPVAHGGAARDAFHLVVPSLPGYGFSGKPSKAGWDVDRIARAWGSLMQGLGYERWAAQGGDWGGIVTTRMGALEPSGLIGIHTNMPLARPSREDRADAGPEAQAALAAGAHYKASESAYAALQSTKPQTIGYALLDSPVALAAWIFEKMHGWTENRGSPFDALGIDTILDNIMVYWLAGTGASAARLYWESFAAVGKAETVRIPCGVTTFPAEITEAPRRWAERTYCNIVYWNDAPKGGHFAAWEQPQLFVEELRRCFALMR